jgi:hypothetical protein
MKEDPARRRWRTAPLRDRWLLLRSHGLSELVRDGFTSNCSAVELRLRGVERLRFHDLRHTAAGLLIAQNVHPKVIQSQLGHSSIRVTLDTYGHLLPRLDEEVADGLEATKVCSRCGLEQPLGEFYRQEGGPHGRRDVRTSQTRRRRGRPLHARTAYRRSPVLRRRPTRQRAGQVEIKVCAGKNVGGSSIPTSFGIEAIASLKRSTDSWDSKTSTM